MLRVSNLNAGYGAIKVLQDVALQVMPGEIVTIIGANGAGKSTMVRLLTGLDRPDTGTVFFSGEPAPDIAARGSGTSTTTCGPTSPPAWRAPVGTTGT